MVLKLALNQRFTSRQNRTYICPLFATLCCEVQTRNGIAAINVSFANIPVLRAHARVARKYVAFSFDFYLFVCTCLCFLFVCLFGLWLATFDQCCEGSWNKKVYYFLIPEILCSSRWLMNLSRFWDSPICYCFVWMFNHIYILFLYYFYTFLYYFYTFLYHFVLLTTLF